MACIAELLPRQWKTLRAQAAEPIQSGATGVN